MPDAVVLGLDVGTSSTKLVAVDRSGEEVATAASDAIPMIDGPPGSGVQATADIWQALIETCGRGMTNRRVEAIAMASQSGSAIPVDRDGAHEVFTWLDTRSQPLVDSWPAATIEKIRACSGWAPRAGLGLSTIAWHRDMTTDRVERWCSVDDYLLWRLTGNWVTNPSNASGMQLMDMATLEWSPELCGLVGIDESMLSDLRPSGTLAGSLGGEATVATGLTPSTKVVMGGHDQTCAVFGLGAIEPGSAVLSMGTAWVLTIVTERDDIGSLPSTLNLSPHVIPDRWTVSQNLGGLGAALATVLHDGGSGVNECGRAPASGDPYFVPAVANSDRTEWGRFISDSDAAVDSVSRLRAVMEACAFEVRRAVDEVRSYVSVGELTVVGGGTQSTQLVEQIADATGLPLTIRADHSWPAIGAASLAATACDWSSPSTHDAMRTVQPDRRESSTRRYHEYRRLKQREDTR